MEIPTAIDAMDNTQLRMAIAEFHGWKFSKETENSILIDTPRYFQTVLGDRTGTYLKYVGATNRITGEPYDYLKDAGIPNWPNDTQAILNLITSATGVHRCEWDFSRARMHRFAIIGENTTQTSSNSTPPGRPCYITANAVSLARAASAAYLKFLRDQSKASKKE